MYVEVQFNKFSEIITLIIFNLNGYMKLKITYSFVLIDKEMYIK